MKAKQIIFLIVILQLIFSGTCNKKTPTGPDNGSDNHVNVEFGGVITLNGQPFSNMEVYLSWDSSKKITTGADGKFNFTNLTSGNYVITPSNKGYVFSPSNYEIGSQTRKDLDFAAQPATYGSQTGNIAVDFTAKDQNGKNVSLHDYIGMVILFDFSADWCGPCRNEATHLEALHNEFKNSGFQIITLLTSGSPSAWATEYNLTFSVLDDLNRKIWNIYGEGSIPLNIIVDRNCTIRYKRAGYDENAIKGIINKYL